MLRNLGKILFLTFVGIPFGQAGEVSTDWIKPVEGEREGTLGATVRRVEMDESGKSSKVTIAIPKPALGDSGDIEEVVVVGRQPDESEEPLEIRHEWVSDYEKDNYGLVLYMGANGNMPLRLYLKSPH